MMKGLGRMQDVEKCPKCGKRHTGKCNTSDDVKEGKSNFLKNISKSGKKFIDV